MERERERERGTERVFERPTNSFISWPQLRPTDRPTTRRGVVHGVVWCGGTTKPSFSRDPLRMDESYSGFEENGPEKLPLSAITLE